MDSMASAGRPSPSPATVGAHFVKKYYGEVLCRAPLELHRFYKDESTFLHSEGSRHEMPVTGLDNIRAKIAQLGLDGASVQIDECGSVDAQSSENGGVVLMVTGEITIRHDPPRQFVQTFVLARNDTHNYYVFNDIFRFLDRPGTRSAATEPLDWKASSAVSTATDEAAIGEATADDEEMLAEEGEAPADEDDDELAEPETTPQEMPPPYSEPSATPIAPPTPPGAPRGEN
ncbi:unnamed protein product [Phaeothamnion confervicola]